MAYAFRLISTSAFEKDVRTLTKRSTKLLSQLESSLDFVQEDPNNSNHQHPIKKLVGGKPCQEQWRIRSGASGSIIIAIEIRNSDL